ncbi:MAG: hypothetical protein NTX76_06010 [Alphaproteobacteria bacterium]|nr:hypothetical protein [Alphaproteobacteria bacterium]
MFKECMKYGALAITLSTLSVGQVNAATAAVNEEAGSGCWKSFTGCMTQTFTRENAQIVLTGLDKGLQIGIQVTHTLQPLIEALDPKDASAVQSAVAVALSADAVVASLQNNQINTPAIANLITTIQGLKAQDHQDPHVFTALKTLTVEQNKI